MSCSTWQQMWGGGLLFRCCKSHQTEIFTEHKHHYVHLSQFLTSKHNNLPLITEFMIFISFIQHIHTFYRHTALFLTNITMSMCYSDNQSNDRFEDILCLDLWATHTYGTYLIIFNSTADTPALQFWPSLNYVIEKHKTLIHICSISISMHLPTNLLAPTNCKHRDFANVTFYLTLCFNGYQWSQTNLYVSIIGKGSKGSNPYLTSPYAQHCHWHWCH